MKKFDVVLIDDDSLIHAMWNYSAKENQKTIDSYYSADAFFAKASEIDRSSPIFIDSNLGNGVRGEAIAKEIKQMGFHEIYLATGHPIDHFEKMDWITAIVGKDPTWK
jgi:hypothetical protein